MATGAPTTERELVDAAAKVLASRLPTSWTVTAQPSAGDPEASDLLIQRPPSVPPILLYVEAKLRIAPRDVEALLGGPWRRWRRQWGDQPILLVAPYVGERVRELLVEENISYVDLTGNIRISVDELGVFIETQGATSEPGVTKQRSGLRGAKAAAVVRALVDVAPPYSAAEIAAAAGVNEGYLSRILATLQDEGLVDREPFGPVTRVDWAALLRRRAQSVDLFRRGRSLRYIARQGAAALLEDLRRRPPTSPPPTVTGSFAAARLAPVAAPALLVLYTPVADALAAELGLLPTDAGADSVLIQPENDVVFTGCEREGGIAWATPSQVVVDCLSGSGRMPSEGEAVLEWMREDERRWRLPALDRHDGVLR